MSDKEILRGLAGTIVYLAAWVVGAAMVAAMLGVFFGIMTKVARMVAA